MLRETALKYIPHEIRLTYDDYCRIPSGERYELIEGALRRMAPAPSVFHQEISKRLGRLLLEWIEDNNLGKVYYAPIDVVLSQHDVVQPDLLYISKERLGIIHTANIQGAPDLVVEILSPNTAEWDRETKRRIYARYGVRELWLVDPDGRSIEVAIHNGRELATLQVYPPGTTMESKLLAGFALEVDNLFRSTHEVRDE
ncbi:MAG: Uma2 family endonuclease [Firmicutes bacterium]|nr:Uma2 family endonuclease [Bacillota bacterium]